MSFQEEPESQIDLTLHRHPDGRDSPPPFDFGDHGPAQYKLRRHCNSNELGSDDTVEDENTASIYSPRPRYEGLESQVEETQFVPIERDTQPSIDYDISPTTRRFLENTETSLSKSPPSIMAMPLLERLDIPAISDGPEFRYGKPTPNNMKLTRPPPGPNLPSRTVMTSTEILTSSDSNLPVVEHVVVSPATGTMRGLQTIQRTPSPALKIMSSHGSSPKGNFAIEENPDSALPDTQIESTHLPDQEVDQMDEVVGVGISRLHVQSVPILASSRDRTGNSLQCNSRRPVEEAQQPENATLCTELLATIKANNSLVDQDLRFPTHAGRQAKSRSPPFIEAALSSDIRTKTVGSPTIANTYATTTGPSTGSGASSATETRTLKPKRTAPRPVAEFAVIDSLQESLILMNPSDQPKDSIPTLLDVAVHERPDHGNRQQSAASDTRVPEASNVPHDRSRNHRPKSRNKNFSSIVSKHRTHRLSPDGSPNRPLPDHQLQPLNSRHNQVLHNTRDSGVSKRILSRANSPHHMQPNNTIAVGGNEQVDAAGLLHMATVMLTVEKEQLDKVVADAQLQETQIEDLSKENAALQERIKCLSEDKRILLTINAGFRKSYEKCKAKMNDVMKIQRELKVDAENLDRKHFEALKAARIEMDIEVLEAKSQVFKDSREILKEARLELDRQNQRIDLLKHDINNQLLDLQRERGLRENLQKQLENRERQQAELKSVLFDHQRSIIASLSAHEDVLKDVLNTGAESTLRLTECRALIKSLVESEAKPIPALIELNDLVRALSTSVKEKIQTTEDGSIQVRDAGVEVLAELKQRLVLLSEDQKARQTLNVIITGLSEENAKLEERIQNREKESLGVGKQLNEVQQELQQCRAQLAATNEDLGRLIAASREDAILRTQLQDLQTSYSITKQHAESSAREAEKGRADLHEQEKSIRLSQQETVKLQDKLQQSEAMVSSFDDQKKAYIRQLKDESNSLRIQMERDFRARLEEDEARHSGIISGLRRQITEANDKLSQAQKTLHDVGKVKPSKEGELHAFSKQLSAVATEIVNLQDKASSIEHTGNRTDSELCISQEQLMQYLATASDWSTRAEENALEFAKWHKEIDDGLKKSENAGEIEVNRFQQIISALQKTNEDSEMVICKIARYLRSRGVLRPDLDFTDWVVNLPCEDSQPETNVSTPQQSDTGEQYDVPALSQESYNGDCRNSVGSSTVSACNRQQDNSARFGVERAPRVANPPHVLFNEDRRIGLIETENSLLTSFPELSCRRPSRDAHQQERDPGMKSLEFHSTFGTSNNALELFPAAKSTSRADLRAREQSSTSNARVSGIKKLGDAARIFTPDSQEELTEEPVPTFERPPRRIAERQQSLAESNRTVTRTEITGISIRTSETYVEIPTLQNDNTVHLPVDSDEESSGLSEPPENMDKMEISEFMDSGAGADCRDPAILRFSDKKAYAESVTSDSVLAPRPNSSRARSRPPVRPKEAKQPRSILKRTNSVAQTTDTVANAKPSDRTVGNSDLDLAGIHGGTAINKRLSKTMSGTSGRNGAPHRSPYNRPVAGSKDLHKSSHFQAQNLPPKEQRPSPADVFNISSSPAMGQPQRNSKKRAFSGVGMRDDNRPTKLPRSARRLS